MKSKTTNGDWFHSYTIPAPNARKGQYMSGVISDKSDLIICKVFGKNKEQCEANAKVIAASKDVLTALIELYETVAIEKEIALSIHLHEQVEKAIEKAKS